jgi:biotin carboxyl carrier protein
VKTLLRVDGREFQLEWAVESETCRFRRESEEERIADVRIVEPGVYSILIDGNSYDVRIEQGRDGRSAVRIGRRRFDVEIADPRKWSSGRRDRGLAGHREIVASMPGKVIRVLVAPGDVVEAGQGLVVVEAMKMQNEMKAAGPGRVARVAVTAGATVESGEVLVVIE